MAWPWSTERTRERTLPPCPQSAYASRVAPATLAWGWPPPPPRLHSRQPPSPVPPRLTSAEQFLSSMPPHDHRHEGWIKREIRKGGRERERKASFHHPSTVVALPRFATLLGHPARRSKLPRLLGPTPSLLALLLASFRLEQKNRGGEERTSPPSTRRRHGLAASIAVCETAKFEIGREGRKKDPLEANRITVSRIIHAYSLLVCIRDDHHRANFSPPPLPPLILVYPRERGGQNTYPVNRHTETDREREFFTV